MRSLYLYGSSLIRNGYHYIAGVDEVGRGAWAGPLVAAAVILPRKFYKLRDSKILKSTEREALQRKIIKLCDHGVGIVSVLEINSHGLTWANHQAMKRAIEKLRQKPDHLLVDYLRLPKNITEIPRTPIIDGDALSASIAAASIVAKVARDEIMRELHDSNKAVAHFAFHRNFGYGTKHHQAILEQYGPTEHHRQNYWPVAKSRQIKMKFQIQKNKKQ